MPRPHHLFSDRMIPACALLLCLAAGCAVTNEENRRLLNETDALIQPDSTAAKIALAPAVIPTGTVAGALDMVVIHPAWVIPEAADDVYELYWKPREMELIRKVLIVPLFAVLTPPTFVGDWLLRSMFDIE